MFATSRLRNELLNASLASTCLLLATTIRNKPWAAPAASRLLRHGARVLWVRPHHLCLASVHERNRDTQ